MKRSLLSFLIVAALSGWISSGERAAGLATAANDWVRTADGWESRQAVEPAETSSRLAVHPAVVAGIQLGASLFFLVAFPARVTVQPVRVSRGVVRTPRGAKLTAAAAG